MTEQQACDRRACEICARHGHLVPDELGVVCTGDPETCTAYKKDRTGFEIGVKYGGGATLYRTVRADNDAVALIRALEYFEREGITNIAKIWIETV